MTDLLLPLSGLIFSGWVVVMFLTLFQLRSLGRGNRYGGQPGIGATLDSWRIFLTAPEWRRRRRLLGLLTLALIGSNAAFYLAFAPGAPDAL
jgi:hypothetical protein